MYMIMLMSLIISLTLLFLMTSHPMSMGLILMLQTILVCLTTSLMNKTSWFSYVLFLIFLGGMLILFIYMTAIASNELFSTTKKNIISMLLTFLLMMILMINLNYYFLNIYKNNEMNNMEMKIIFLKENNLMLNKMYNFPTNFMTFMLINYLFLTLIIIVKMTQMFYGPLRSMN